MPEIRMNDYERCWRKHAPGPKGWPHATPYLEHPTLRRLLTYLSLSHYLERLIGEPPGLHLNLTGWVSTERDWHSDQYLNEPGVDDAYAAVWVALDDIHPDSGPFQYVAGSHRWPQVNREKLLEATDLTTENPEWPKLTEDVVASLLAEEIEARQATVSTYLPHRGDVLIWHPRLVHRGSKPKVPGLERRAVIAHYSGVSTRSKIDMPNYRREIDGGFYFTFQHTTPV